MAATTEFLYQRFGESEVKLIYSVITSITCVFATCLFIGLLFREVNIHERSKTLINKIYSLLLSYCVGLLMFLNFIDVARALIGPLPVILCKISAASVQGFAVTFSMGLIEAIVVKYIYCCVLNSFGGLDDDFYMCFFVIINGVMFIYVTGFLVYANITTFGPMAMCCGCDPVLVLKPVVYHSVIPFPIYMLWIVFSIHLILQPRIIKVESSLSSCTNKKKTIFIGWTNILIFFLFVVFFTMIQVIMDKSSKPATNYNDLNLVRPAANMVLGCGILAYSYFTHPHIRNFICPRRTYIEV